jgi:hypothetical protein
MELTTKTENRGRWQPGQSGNMAGKPPGARHRFSAAFLQDLADVWQAHGRDTMIATAQTNPQAFFAIASKLVPASVQVTMEQTFGGLSPEDLAIFQAIREAIPEANSRSPAEVLEYVRDTLRAADAKLIEAPPPSVSRL